MSEKVSFMEHVGVLEEWCAFETCLLCFDIFGAWNELFCLITVVQTIFKMTARYREMLVRFKANIKLIPSGILLVLLLPQYNCKKYMLDIYFYKKYYYI